MPPRRLRLIAYVAVLAVLGVATQWVDGTGMGWLALAPMLLLLLPLMAGRYLGEVALQRLAGRSRTGRRRSDARPPMLWRFVGSAPHGGLVLARRIAGRAPPLVA